MRRNRQPQKESRNQRIAEIELKREKALQDRFIGEAILPFFTRFLMIDCKTQGRKPFLLNWLNLTPKTRINGSCEFLEWSDGPLLPLSWCRVLLDGLLCDFDLHFFRG